MSLQRTLPCLLLAILIVACSDDASSPATDGPSVTDSGPPADSASPDAPATPLKVTCDATPKSGAPPLAVSFTAQATGGAGSYGYAWDFGDGTSSTEQNPAHSYALIGKHTATLTVTSGTATETCSQTITTTVDQSVTVPAGGGKGQLTIEAKQGQQLSITLTADSSLEPYGYLENPDATGTYVPEDNQSVGGVNTGQITTSQTGTHVYAVYDSTNTGGEVQVKIEEAP